MDEVATIFYTSFHSNLLANILLQLESPDSPLEKILVVTNSCKHLPRNDSQRLSTLINALYLRFIVIGGRKVFVQGERKRMNVSHTGDSFLFCTNINEYLSFEKIFK